MMNRLLYQYKAQYSNEHGLHEAQINKKASLVCGTYGKWLWLLRSRPDQVGHATMRRGPPGTILSAIDCGGTLKLLN